MKISKFRSIKYEMVWRVAIPIVLIFIGTVLFLYQLFQNSSAESVNNQLMFQAESITTSAEEFFKLNAVTTEQLSGDPVTKAVMRQCEQGVYICDTPQYPTLMQSLKNCDATQGDTYIQSYIASWNANDLATSAGDNSHIDWPELVVPERGWAIDTMNSGGKTIYTAPYVDTASGKMCCTISSPIMDESGKCIGAAAADIEMTKLQELFANADITGEHGFAVVFLPDNTTFYHPYEDMVGLDIHDLGLNEEVINAVLDKDTGTVIEYDAMGTSWIGTITEIENTGWVIATSTVKAEAYQSVISSIMMLIAALLIVLILIVLVLMAVAKNIGGPIMKLADIAHQMAVGDLSFELEREEKVRDEIDILVNAVVDMAENSKEQAASLQKLAMGDANLEVIPKSENDIVNTSLAKVVATLKELLSETTMLTQESIAGNTGVRGDANKFSGGYKAIIAGVNNTLDAIMAEVGNMSDVITALGQGQLPEIENNAKGDYAVITDNLINTVGAIKALVDDTQGMASAAIDGDYSVRADAEKYNGEYKNVIEGINATLDMVVAKTAWFEAIIDSIPEPVQVMDNEKKWTLVNKAFAAPYIEMGMIKKAADFYGKPCHMDGMNICGVDALVNEGKAEMQMNYGNEIYRQTTGVLKDQKGNAIGYVGTIQDLTAITKQAEYSDAAAARLERNLANLANGVFEFEPNEIQRNEYTKDLEVTFDAIDSAVESVTEAVDLLVTDSVKLAGYAVSGQLDKRAPLDKYKGEYAKVMKGMNDTVDALTAPINELINVLEAVGNGDLSKEVYGDYQGDLVKSKNALNETVYTLRAVIEDIKSVLAAIGSGDLTVQISDNYKGDFIAIKESFLEIIDNLTDVMGNINESSAQVAAGSKQLSDGAQTLANGSTKQAAAVQQLSMTIGKVAEQTKKNTEDAKKASTLSSDVMHMAEKGNVQMKDMLVSMEEINESSANISKIIKVIDDIAFQTNILALNAAVEAARAGVHGKGFAVVADEVRNLAAKSAEAAAETTSLIEGSVSKVNAGTQIANATAEALEAIVSGITETSNLCDAIAVVSEEQAAGIDEVNTGIEQVSEVIQSNSATAQQSAASSEELYGQADMLKKQVAQFKLKGSKNVHAAIPAPAARPAKEDTPIMITLDDFGGSDKY